MAYHATTLDEVHCGRRGTQNEGCCIYCMEKNQDWRIAVQVRQIIADALRPR